MAELPIRCKFYDLDGNSIAGGCRYGIRCHFIHPSDPNWNDAVPHKGRGTSDRFKDDRLKRSAGSGYSRRVSHSHTRYDRENFSSSKGESNRGHTRSYSSDNPWSKAPEILGRKRSFDSGPSTNQANEYIKSQPRSVGGWGSTDIPGATDTPVNTWADSSKDTNWGSGEAPNRWREDSSAWGSSSWGGASGWGNGGWGEGTSNKSGKDASGWGSGDWGDDTTLLSNTVETSESKQSLRTNQSAPNSPSILSTSPAFSRHQRSSDHQEISSKHSPSNKPSTDTLPFITTAIRKLSQDVETKEAASPTFSSAPAPAAKRARLPLPTRIQQATRDATENFLTPSPVVYQDWGRIPLSGSISGCVQSDDVASESSTSTLVLASLDPKELQSKLIKNIIHAVFIRDGLLKAEERKEKWRNARGSTCYQHSTPAAQKILESTNHQLSEEISGLTKQLKVSLNEIIKCSDALSMHKDLLEQGIDQRKVLHYTDELRDWVRDLDLEKTLMCIKMTIEQEGKERKARRNHKRGEVKELKNAIYELELQITDISDDLHSLQDSLVEFFRKEYSATEKILRKREHPADLLDLEGRFTELGLGNDVFEGAQKKIRDMDLKALSQCSRIDELGEHIKVLEEEVKDLKEKEQQIIEFRKQANVTMKRMEERKQEDKARMDKISQQIEVLHTQPKPHPPVPHPIKPEDLTPFVDQLVIEYVATEIKPTLVAISDAVNADIQQFTAEFNELIEQVVMKTYDLVQVALKANGFVPHLVPSPT